MRRVQDRCVDVNLCVWGGGRVYPNLGILVVCGGLYDRFRTLRGVIALEDTRTDEHTYRGGGMHTGFSVAYDGHQIKEQSSITRREGAWWTRDANASHVSGSKSPYRFYIL